MIDPQNVFGYNLDRPAETWKGMTNSAERPAHSDVNFRDAFIGQNHWSLLDQPAGPAAQRRPDLPPARLRPLPEGSRRHPGESGRLDYSVTVTDPAGIAPQWQACDGGFYYATSDGKVQDAGGGEAEELGLLVTCYSPGHST